MQKLLGFAVLMCGAFIISCNSAQQEQNAPAQASRIEIKVPTIQCKNCVANVEKALKAVDGVQSVKVNLEGKLAAVSYDGGKLGLNDLEKVITAAGYDANEKKRDPEAYDMLDACCKEPKDGGGH